MTADAPSEPGRRRILVVDDHPLYRAGIRQFIDAEPDLVCCGEADASGQALEAVPALEPDLVILDLRLHREDGLGLIRQILALRPTQRILVLSQNDEAVFAERVLRGGAQGYIMKETATEELLTAIRAVLGGELYVSRPLSATLLRRYLGRKPGDAASGQLSDREFQVFQLVGSGLGTREIAIQLRVSVKTVETHKEHIKQKLGLPDASSLARAARDWLRLS